MKKKLNKDLTDQINQSIKVKKKLINQNNKINKVIEILFETIKNKKKILICGNGGSAADAQHIAAEGLIRLKPNVNRKPIPIISLATDTSTITACANDYTFEELFARNLDALGSKGDALIAISTSGNSKNIIKVLKIAKKLNINSIVLLGNNGGKSKQYSKNCIIVNSKNTARIQEAHIFLGHYIMSKLEEKLLKYKII